MSGNDGGFRVPSSIPTESNRSYALSGKIMLSAIVVLFFVLILMFTLHLYARWYLLHVRRRRHSRDARRNPRRTQLVFYVGPDATVAAPAARGGLDARVLKSLPVFSFSSETHPDSALECAVCLSGFEENESGRVLPKCKHTFHLECIDMWFHSHSTCPLCRNTVEETVPVSENPRDIILTTNNEPLAEESGPNQRSDLFATCQHDDGRASTSTIGAGRKLSVEVPTRSNEGIEGEPSGCDSGPSQSYKSPMSRMLSFKRILSRERRGSGSITVSESDIERGSDETRQTQG